MIVLIYSGTYLLKSTAKPMLTFFHSTYGIPLHGDFMSESPFNIIIHGSLFCWLSFTCAAVCIGTVPEGACGRCVSLGSCPADGVGSESRGAVILRRNDPLPEASASVLRSARRLVLSGHCFACAAGDLTRNSKLSRLAALLAPGFHPRLRVNCGVPATLKRLIQLLRGLRRSARAISARNAYRV